MQTRYKELSVLLPTAGMEICRLHILASVFFIVSGSADLPFGETSAVLAAALVLTRIFRKFRRRRIVEYLAGAVGLAVSLYFILGAYGGLPFASAAGFSGWAEAFRRIEGVPSWYSFWLLVAWGFVFWLRGVSIGGGGVTYSATVSRFDGGIGIMLFVFFIRMGLRQADTRGLSLTTAYFLFGIAALFAAKSLDRDDGFSGARSAASLILPFIAGFMILGTALYSLYPLLVRTAGGLYEVMARGARPLGPFLTALLRLIFGFGFARAAADGTGSPGGGEAGIPMVQEHGFWARLVEKIFAWSMFGILGLLAAFFAGWMIWKLVKHLLARTEGDGGLPTLGELLRRFFASFAETLRSLFRRAASIARGLAKLRRPAASGEGAAGFRMLCSWGRTTGLKKMKTETPAEYGNRLSASFPAVGGDVELLVRLAEAEFYGGRTPSAESRRRARLSRLRLRSPGLLPARILFRLRPGRRL